jgi:hypothetical protein
VAAGLTTWASLVALAATSCHENPNSGLPVPGVRLPWRTYEPCAHPIETYGVGAIPKRPYRVLSRTSVTCTYYVPEECDDALKARACELGGDGILVESLDESSTPKGPYVSSTRNPKKMRSASIVAWETSSTWDAGASRP